MESIFFFFTFLSQYIKVLIDQRLINEPIGNRIIPNFDTINVKYELNQQLVPRTLFWQRNIQQTFINNDDMVRFLKKNIKLLHRFN